MSPDKSGEQPDGQTELFSGKTTAEELEDIRSRAAEGGMAAAKDRPPEPEKTPSEATTDQGHGPQPSFKEGAQMRARRALEEASELRKQREAAERESRIQAFQAEGVETAKQINEALRRTKELLEEEPGQGQ